MKTRIHQGITTLPPFQRLNHHLGRALTYAAIGLGVFFAPATQGQTNGCTAAPSGLISWWRGEGDTFDSVRTNHGSAVGGVTIAPGKVGTGFGFDGTGYIVVPHHPSLNCSNALTIELWYNSTQSNDVYYGIIDKRVGAVGANYGINVAADAGLGVYYDDLAVQDGDDAVSSFETSRYAPAPEPGMFHHLAATYRQISNNLVRLETYVDGQKVRTRNIAGNLPNTLNTSPVTIGATALGAGEFFKGVIDEISIYNRVLNSNEITAIFQAGDAGKCVATTVLPTNGIPQITSVVPSFAAPGAVVTIYGTNFNPVALSNLVTFGAVRVKPLSATTTQLTVAVPVGATYAPITVTVNGRVAYAPQPFQPTFAGGAALTNSSFAPRFDLAGGDGGHRSSIVDLDGDGRPDLAVADVYGHTISLFRNISSPGALSASSFESRVELSAEGGGFDNPYGFLTADVDGDGRPDLIACDRFGGNLSVFRNVASPGTLTTNSFAPRVNFGVGADPRNARVADLNGDGLPDMVSCNFGGNTLSILRNLGGAGALDTNSFAPAVTLPAGTGSYDVAIGDLDGDGKPDLAVVNLDELTLSLYRNLAQPGTTPTNWFAARVNLPALEGNDTIAIGDLDGDGRLDLVMGSFRSRTISIYRNQAVAGVLNTNSFAARVDFPTDNWTHTVALGDLNGDAKPDIAAVGELDSYLSIFQNLITPGGFTTTSLGGRVDFGAGWNGWGVSVGDLDGDSRPDVVFGNAYDDTITIYRNVIAISNVPPVNCVTPPSGIVSWWRADGDALDSISVNHGTLTGDARLASGRIGQGFVFDGNRDGMSAGTSPNLQLQDFTVEAWIKRSSDSVISFNGNGNGQLFTVGAGGGGYTFYLQADSRLALGKLQVNVVTSDAVVTDTNWHHVAVTKTGTIVYFFVDGVPYAAPAYNSGGFTFDGPAYVGAWLNPSQLVDNTFYGAIDEMAVYNRALSTNEIAAIYASASDGKCLPISAPPTIAQQPQSILTNGNANVQFWVLATGIPAPTYQWFFAGDPLAGRTNATLALTGVQPTNAGNYFVIVANASGSVTSSVATLTVLTYPPTITVQPQDRTVYAGKTASLSVQATGTAPLRYQWSRNGTNILNATSQTLTLTNVQTNATGLYRVLVSNNYGSTNSRSAQLTVVPPPVCFSPAEGVIAWWPGESNTMDVVGGFDLAFLQSPPTYLLYTTGKVGAALDLGKTSTYGTVTTGGALNVNAGTGLTIEGWIRPTTSSIGPLAEWNDGRGFVGAGLLINSTGPGVIEATLTDTNTPLRIVTLRSTLNVVTNGIWQHVALTYDKVSGLAAIYVNGISVAQTNVGVMKPNTSGDVYLGYRRSGSYSGTRFNGALDEIALYNRALSPTEIQALVMADEAGKCPLPPAACQIPVTDLAGWWRGESNVLDSIGFSHGFITPSNTPATSSYSAGRYGAAFSMFSGSYPTIPASPSLDVGTGAGLTVEGWVSYNSGYPLVEWNSGTGTQGVSIAYSATRGPGYIEANLMDSQGQSHVLSSPFMTPTYQQWQHVAVTYDRTSGFAALFVNGASVAQTNLGSFTLRTTGNLYFGYRPIGSYPGSGNRLAGWLDEIAVYRRALSASELRCVYRAGAAKYPAALACVPPAAGIVGWWRGESNTVDSVQTNHGVYSPGQASANYIAGRVGQAFTTGVGKYVTIRSPQGLDVGRGPGLTVESWINPTNTTIGSIFGWGDNTIGVSLDYASLGGAPIPILRANLTDTNGITRSLATPGSLVKTGQWQHVVLTYDRASGWATIYLNGTPVTATNFGSFTLRTTGSLNLGWRTGGNYFIGAIDETAVYNRALAAPEINAIYQATTGRCLQPPVIVQAPGNRRVNAGSNVTFTVVAEGNPLLRYQWGLDRSPLAGNLLLPGQTNATLTLTNVQTKDGGRYWIRVTNAFGTAAVSNILLTVNFAPVANSQTITTPEDIARSFNLSVFDPNQDPLLYTILTQPTNGVLSGTAPNLVYTPRPNFFGSDSFTFRVFDGLLNSAVATVAITVTPVNDPPVAISQIVATDEDTPLFITLGATDVEGEALTFAVTPPTHGQLSGIAPNLVYTPNTNYYGDDLFTFTAQDASGGVSHVAAISITVRPVNDAPVAKIEIAPLDELPGVTNTISIAPVCCAATLRLDASKSSDVENDPLTYAWLAGTNVFSTAAITTNRFQPGTHEVTLVVSDGIEAVTKTITVEILTTSEAVGYLKLLVEAGVTERNTRMPLLNWLRQAGDFFDRCQVEQGVHFLEMFKARVEERLAATDPELATSLMDTAAAIIEAAPDCDPCHRLGRQDSKHENNQPRDERDERGNSGNKDRGPDSKSGRDSANRRDESQPATAEIKAERSSPKSR